MSRVEFVSYTGGWPALCMGELTVLIEGKEVTFGNAERSSFWASGGSCVIGEDGEEVDQGPWKLTGVPEEYGEYADELIECFNENVPQGCCGGCI